MGEQDARIRRRAERRARGDRIGSLSDARADALLDILDSSIGRLDGPSLRPKPAAALIVVDWSGEEPRLLMGRRNPNLAFMGGFLVFPGGRLDPADRRMRPLEDLSDDHAGARPLLRALALTAIRETFEETGYLLGVHAPAQAPPGAWSDFVAHGVAPTLNGMRLVARAVTPPGHVRRFDTAFFRVDAAHIAHRAPRLLGADDELTDIGWVAASELENPSTLAITQVIAYEALRDDDDAGAPCYSCPYGKWLRD
jgi:8-oxo-dGTP pyrophosphatase MutT (NUDIX family)